MKMVKVYIPNSPNMQRIIDYFEIKLIMHGRIGHYHNHPSEYSYKRLHTNKVQITQQLLTTDHAQRRKFTSWILYQTDVNADFAIKIIFSDEAYFHLNGFVNRQNCRI